MINRISATYQQQTLAQAYRSNRPGHTGEASNLQSKSAEVEDIVDISHTDKSLDVDAQPTNSTDEETLSEDQKRQVDQLKQRDQEVKAHERAHMAAGGGLVQGGASYSYQRGADGKLYAVGGEVKIDTSSERDPEQTIQKMEQVKRAALAPAQPSATDRAVAARAAQVQLQARMEKMQANEDDTTTSNQNQDPNIDPADPSPYAASDDETEYMGQKIDIAV